MNHRSTLVRFMALKGLIPGHFFIALTAMLAACANIVSPTGGPKDTTPPVVEVASPPSGSTRFREHSFSLRFNEFIQIQNLQQQLLVSPPLAEAPSIRLKGKTLIISFKDTLRTDATYAFHFGESIKDITEGNAMAPYSYFFATGDSIDNHVLHGEVFNALDGKVAENLLVMLYAMPMHDSAVAREVPRYITRPDKNGEFVFRHIASGLYHLVALNDLNNNMQYDLITEGIAFSPRSVIPWIEQTAPIAPLDSLRSDTLSLELDLNETPGIEVINDTTEAVERPDSIVGKPQQEVKSGDRMPSIRLRMFVAEDSIQKVLSARSEGRNKALVALRYPTADLRVTPLQPFSDSMLRWETNPTGDTLTCWLAKHTHDTLALVIASQNAFTDTVFVPLRPIPTSPRSKPQLPVLNLQMNIPRNGKLKPNEHPMVHFDIPLRSFDFSSATFAAGDSVTPLLLLPADSSVMRSFRVLNPITPDTQYRVLLPPKSCLAWDGTLQPDTLTWTFSQDAADQFGTLSLVPEFDSLFTGSVLLVLSDEKGRAIETRMLQAPYGVQSFQFLRPGKYVMSAINDRNGNNRWDTGDYWKRIQPEEILKMPGSVNIRANWIEEIVWEIRFSSTPEMP